VEVGEGSSCRQAPLRGRKSTAMGHPAAQEAKRAGPSAEQVDLGE